MNNKVNIMWGIVLLISTFFSPFSLQGQELHNKLDRLIPKVQNYSLNNNGDVFILDSKTTIISENSFLANYLNDRIKNCIAIPLKVSSYKAKKNNKKAIILRCDSSVLKNFNANRYYKKEGYVLNINNDLIEIIGEDYGGIFNGIQTLLQLLPEECYNFSNKKYISEIPIKGVKISDYPKYRYRGFHFDVARTWRTKEDVYRVIEYMAHHKINKFHWHLTDDQGWRIEIKSYPLLTEKGAFRGPNEALKPVLSSGNKRYGGFYTQQDIKDVVKFAKERNIEVIPEIELPGHSRAAASSYPDIICTLHRDSSRTTGVFSRPIWCVAKESNYQMLDSIFREMTTLFETDILNIGGDEVNHYNWKTCHDCQALMQKEGLKDEYDLHNYFIKRLDKIAHKYNKRIAGWEEIMEAGELDPETIVYVWKNAKLVNQAVLEKHPYVLQIGEYSYFDMKQSPIERGHNWAGVVTLEKSYMLDPIKMSTPPKEDLETAGLTSSEVEQRIDKYLLGVQGGLWEELGINPENFYDYQYFPRMLSIAEIGWGTNNKITNWQEAFNDFNNRIIYSHYKRMNNMGIKYRVPYPVVTADEIANVSNDKKLYKISVAEPYKDADIRYAIVKPQTEFSGIRGINDTTNYKYKYSEPIITYDIAKYRFATFVSDTLHSIGVAVSNMPIYNLQTPSFEIETNLDYKPEALAALKDYDIKTSCAFNNRIKAGDYIYITFDEPVQCSVIDIITARYPVDFYGIVEGYVDYSEDGITYNRGGDFIRHRAVTEPKTKVKYLRINITGDGDSNSIHLNDLIIY